MAKPAKARKGDLILVELTTRNHWSLSAVREARDLGRELPDTVTTYQFGIVASATRDGQAKTWSPIGFGDALICSGPGRELGVNQRRWVLSAKDVDVTAALTSAKAHHWPGHPDHPRAFDSYRDATRALQEHLPRHPLAAASVKALAELNELHEEIQGNARQYDAWCARHGVQRDRLKPWDKPWDAMLESDHAEALAEDSRRSVTGAVA